MQLAVAAKFGFAESTRIPKCTPVAAKFGFAESTRDATSNPDSHQKPSPLLRPLLSLISPLQWRHSFAISSSRNRLLLVLSASSSLWTSSLLSILISLLSRTKTLPKDCLSSLFSPMPPPEELLRPRSVTPFRRTLLSPTASLPPRSMSLRQMDRPISMVTAAAAAARRPSDTIVILG
ncbi:hypothetical protein OPV22_000471 [Ensete ventricosum]|uniref:Uncharacterized protein n=1 Tax=Ensete ventricosum TaxID=4639 RepID=A0AAV8RVE7_ENSVE|nr:hypothetical protein OPV22_000471 [Ensete ventricosum]